MKQIKIIVLMIFSFVFYLQAKKLADTCLETMIIYYKGEETDRNANESKYEYNPDGSLNKVITINKNPDFFDIFGYSVTKFNTYGNPQKKTVSINGKLYDTHIYDYEHNSNGDIIRRTMSRYDSDGNISDKYISNFEYDLSDNTIFIKTNVYDKNEILINKDISNVKFFTKKSKKLDTLSVNYDSDGEKTGKIERKYNSKGLLEKQTIYLWDKESNNYIKSNEVTFTFTYKRKQNKKQ